MCTDLQPVISSLSTKNTLCVQNLKDRTLSNFGTMDLVNFAGDRADCSEFNTVCFINASRGSL